MTQSTNGPYESVNNLLGRLTTRRLDTSLSRLAAATAVKPTPTANQARTDEAQVADPSSVVKALREGAPLRSLSGKLVELRQLVTRGAASPAGAIAQWQAKIDDSLKSLRDIAERAGVASSQINPGPGGQGVAVNIDPGVFDVQVNAPALKPGESLDIEAQVVASAQVGALALSFGNAQLSLLRTPDDPDPRFVFEVAGPEGLVEISLASGTALTAIAEIINSFSAKTGVTAEVSGTSVSLRSGGFGADEFVSVRVLDDGGITPQAAGVYRYLPADNFQGDESTRVAFEDASSAITDEGQDVRAIINGQEVQGDGLRLAADLDGVKVAFELSVARAQQPTAPPFIAFTVEETLSAASPQSQSALAQLLEAPIPAQSAADRVSRIDDAIREVEQLERAQLLSRGLTPEIASFTSDDLDVIREAQLKLIQEARRVGLVSDPDPESALDALRG